MNHSFDIEHAQKYGLREAILIGNFQFWIGKNKANGRHIYEGRAWTYNSVKAFGELFPYMTSKHIRSSLLHLIDAGVLMTGNYNANASDRTLWYAFVDETIFLPGQMELPRKETPFSPRGKSTNKTDSKPDGKPDSARASRLPADWMPSDDDLSFCKQERPDLTPQDTASRFRDYWIAIPGKRGEKSDWSATWRNWVRNERRGNAAPAAKPAKQSRHSGFDSLDYSEGL